MKRPDFIKILRQNMEPELTKKLQEAWDHLSQPKTGLAFSERCEVLRAGFEDIRDTAVAQHPDIEFKLAVPIVMNEIIDSFIGHLAGGLS